MQPTIRPAELHETVADLVNSATPSSRTIVGIVGPPASGKSTVAAGVGAALGAPVVPMDGFHLSDKLLTEAGLSSRKGAPETFDVAGFSALLQQLQSTRQTIYCPNFDRSRSNDPIDDDIRVDATDALVLVEGNYLLLDDPGWASIKEMLTLSVFIDIDQLVRLKRLAVRHIAGGRTRSNTWAFIRSSDEPNARRIEASKHHATLLLQPS